jgi:hypothetical protein
MILRYTCACHQRRGKSGCYCLQVDQLHLGHHRPRHPCEFVGKRDGGDLGGSAGQQRREPGSMRRAIDLGIADHGKRAGRKQAAQVAITLFADTAEFLFARSNAALAPTRSRLRSRVLIGMPSDPQYSQPGP